MREKMLLSSMRNLILHEGMVNLRHETGVGHDLQSIADISDLRTLLVDEVTFPIRHIVYVYRGRR